MATELIAHRGASRERRENTLPAFARALELGADGIELDTHATSDGIVVVHHDPEPHGETMLNGLAGKPFTAITAREAASFRFPDGSHIPTLAEVAELVGDRAVLYVELKGRDIEDRVVESLLGARARYALHSFDHRTMKRVHSKYPDVTTGILTSSYLLDPESALRDSGARDYWQGSGMVDLELLERVHAVGGRVIAWTVNRAEDAAALQAAGVDGICSDDLRVIRPRDTVPR